MTKDPKQKPKWQDCVGIRVRRRPVEQERSTTPIKARFRGVCDGYMGMPHSTKWYLSYLFPREGALGRDAPKHEAGRDQASDERKPLGGVPDRMMLMGAMRVEHQPM
jgi:hypothetical protein